MKKISVIAAAIFALAFIFSSATFSQPAGMNGKMGQGKGMRQGMGMKKEMSGGFPMLMAKLKLTDQQKEKIAGLRIDFQKNMIDLRANLAKDRLGLKELRLKDNLNRSDVLDAVGKINKDRDAIALAVANHMLDVYEILTPEQQKIAKQAVFNSRWKMNHMRKEFQRNRMMN